MRYKITLTADSIEDAISKLENINDELDLSAMEPEETVYGDDLTVEAIE